MVVSILLSSCYQDQKHQIDLKKYTSAEVRSLGCTVNLGNGCVRTNKVNQTFSAAGCDWLVNYTLEICPTGIKIFDMSVVDYDATDAGCAQFINVITPWQRDGRFDLLILAYNRLYSNLSLAIESKELRAIPNKGDYSCFDDENTPTNFSSEFISAACISTCILRSNPIATTSICGGACCIRYTAFCFSENNILVMSPPQINNNGTNCDTETWVNDCESGGFTTGCERSCARITPNPIQSDTIYHALGI